MKTTTFGSALELCIAMSLSWLPLISDYTCCADKPKKSTLVSILVYLSRRRSLPLNQV